MVRLHPYLNTFGRLYYFFISQGLNECCLKYGKCFVKKFRLRSIIFSQTSVNSDNVQTKRVCQIRGFWASSSWNAIKNCILWNRKYSANPETRDEKGRISNHVFLDNDIVISSDDSQTMKKIESSSGQHWLEIYIFLSCLATLLALQSEMDHGKRRVFLPEKCVWTWHMKFLTEMAKLEQRCSG